LESGRLMEGGRLIEVSILVSIRRWDQRDVYILYSQTNTVISDRFTYLWLKKASKTVIRLTEQAILRFRVGRVSITVFIGYDNLRVRP